VEVLYPAPPPSLLPFVAKIFLVQPHCSTSDSRSNVGKSGQDQELPATSNLESSFLKERKNNGLMKHSIKVLCIVHCTVVKVPALICTYLYNLDAFPAHLLASGFHIIMIDLTMS
jgi:hypothetical protein